MKILIKKVNRQETEHYFHEPITVGEKINLIHKVEKIRSISDHPNFCSTVNSLVR